MTITLWQPFELSCTAAPLGIRSRVTGGLLGPPERDADAASVDTKTTARLRKAPARPRRTLDAGLERESSPVTPPRRAVTSQATYVDGLIRERHTAMTTALDAITRAAPASARQAGGAGAGDTPADSPDASPLARLIQVAASPASPRVHHKTEDLELMMDGGRGWARLPLGKVMERAPVQRAAFDSTNVTGAIGEQVAGEIRQVVLEDAAVTAILAGVTTVESVTNNVLPAELLNDDTLASWVAEGAQTAFIDAALRDYGDALIPKIARVSTSYSLQLAIQAGPRFEAAVEAHIRRALRKRIVQGILTGSGVNNQPRGIVETPGVMASAYISADRGRLSTFYNCEDLLDADGQGPVDAGRLWVVSRNLYALARRIPAWGPGGDQRTLDANTIGRGRVGLDTPAVATNLLAADTALYGAFPDCVLFAWEQAQVVVDKISSPGDIRISVLAFVNISVRPNSFAVLRPA